MKKGFDSAGSSFRCSEVIIPCPSCGAKSFILLHRPIARERCSFRALIQCYDCLLRLPPCPLGTSQIRLIRSWQERHHRCQGVNKFVLSASCQKPAPKGGPFQAKILIRLVTSIRNPFTLLRSISSIISTASASGSGQDCLDLAPLVCPPFVVSWD